MNCVIRFRVKRNMSFNNHFWIKVQLSFRSGIYHVWCIVRHLRWRRECFILPDDRMTERHNCAPFDSCLTRTVLPKVGFLPLFFIGSAPPEQTQNNMNTWASSHSRQPGQDPVGLTIFSGNSILIKAFSFSQLIQSGTIRNWHSDLCTAHLQELSVKNITDNSEIRGKDERSGNPQNCWCHLSW